MDPVGRHGQDPWPQWFQVRGAGLVGRLAGAAGGRAEQLVLRVQPVDLWLLAAILSDSRFPAYLRRVNSQIAVNYLYLRDELAPPLAMSAMDAGCFCLVDAAGLGLDDVSYAGLLRDHYQALVVPVSWFPARARGPETRVRVSLARSGEEIFRLAAALNDSVGHHARHMPADGASRRARLAVHGAPAP